MFDESEHAGRWWSTARGLTPALLALLRSRSNSNLASLAVIVELVREVAPRALAQSNLKRSFDLLKTSAPSAVTHVARHPSFSYWISATSHLLRVASGAEPSSVAPSFVDGSSDPLTDLLNDLSRFAVAAALMGDQPFEHSLQAQFPAPVTFPGAGIAVFGISAGEQIIIRRPTVGAVVTFERGSGSVELGLDSPHSSPALSWRRVPRVKGAFEVDSWDPYFRHIWVRGEVFPDGNRAPMVEDDDLPNWSRIMTSAMDLLASAHPEFEAEIRLMVQSVVPVMSPDPSKNLSVTAPEFWGAVQCTLDPAPMMGEVLVHEYRHNLLHALETMTTFFLPDSPRDSVYYSPWRDDPRPLHGILHAIFTFSGVVSYYLGLLENVTQPPSNDRAARRRACAHTARLRLGLEQLRSARMTAFGKGLVQGIEAQVQEFEVRVKTIEGQETEDAIETVRAHARQRLHSESLRII